MAKDVVGKLRDDLDKAREELETLRMSLAEAAQKETEQTRIIQRQHREMSELKLLYETEKLRLEGFQLELQARHYELPFIAANLDALLHGANWPEPVAHILSAMKQSITSLMEHTKGQQPTLDPATWLLLAKRLGFAMTFQTRRHPVLRGAGVSATVP